MANIFLSGEAFARIKSVKRADESFSDVILREVKQDLNLRDYLGVCKGVDVEKAVAEIRRERNR